MAARPVDAAALRTVHVSPGPEAQKVLYFDERYASVRPNLVFVDANGAIIFETNAVGLKGDPVDPNRKLAVVWGDSVVFGSSRGWPCLLDSFAAGWQFLNGGVEGDLYSNVLRRADQFNRRYRVALNLLMLGWHPFIPVPLGRRKASLSFASLAGRQRLRPGNENIRAELTCFLERTPNTVVLTIPTALNGRIVHDDLSGYRATGDDSTSFRFLGDLPFHVEAQRQGFAHIVERNAIAREVCHALGIRLIDLFAAFNTEDRVDFREHFYDVIHFRPTAYPIVAQTVFDGIKDLLA